MKNKNVVKDITPEQLQGMFLDYARELCAERLEDVKACPSYKEHSKDAYEEYRCWFDALLIILERRSRQSGIIRGRMGKMNKRGA